MGEDKGQVPAHPAGEQPPVAQEAPPASVTVDCWAGQIKVEWDPQAPLTPLGQASFFIEFLKVSGAFDALVADCPLYRTSPNAFNRDVLGTLSCRCWRATSAMPMLPRCGRTVCCPSSSVSRGS
jgi:hypothetical protein